MCFPVWVQRGRLAKANKETPAEVEPMPNTILLSCCTWRGSRTPGSPCHQEMKGTECVKLQIGGMEREQTPESFSRKGSSNPLAA